MLEDYKELCRTTADIIPDWENMTKNELCRAYVANKGNSALQNAYMGAILYRYWNLIGKYYYMSSNCATPEECYGWLVDSVACCVNLAAWQNPSASIYNDPNGPDKVINRCMKCARLTYYQFINRKKRKDNFGLMSIEELQEQFENGGYEPADPEQEVDLSSILIYKYIVDEFKRKNYFISFLIYFILSTNAFDETLNNNQQLISFNVRKICKTLNTIDSDQLKQFSIDTKIPLSDVVKAFEYIKMVPAANMRKKVLQALEDLKHSALIESLVGGN